MLLKKKIYFLCLFGCIHMHAQVGIGTSSPAASSLLQLESTSKTFVPPRMTDVQMQSISDPIDGSLVYNTSKNSIYLHTSSGWQGLAYGESPSVVLAKNSGQLTLNTPGFSNFPLVAGNATYISQQSYEVVSTGKIKVKEDGVFLMSASLAVVNLPSGYVKYAIGIRVNGQQINIMNQGFTNSPEVTWWGTNGSFIMNLSENDVVDFIYELSEYRMQQSGVGPASARNLSLTSLNTGITKIQ